MTLYQFNALSESEQAATLWEIGIYLTEREDHIFKYALYQMGIFYVEVWYHKELNAIQRLRSFSSTIQLEPYLKRIDVGEIIL
jgi:hypothetical protein